MTVLRALTKQKVELVPVYATLRHSGAAFLTALTYYRDLEGRQRTLRARIRREKQSVRSHLTYWKTRVRPDTFAGLEREAGEILASLDVIRYPNDQAVAAYRRRLGIYRGGTQPGRHHFWTYLIGWTVKRIRKAGCTDNEACEIVASLLHALWPRLHPNNPSVVKSRYYRTL